MGALVFSTGKLQCEVIADSDVVGLSLMTNYVRSAREISANIRHKYPEKLIVWGGVHPTIRPEECLDHADIAVVGDGTNALGLWALGNVVEGETTVRYLRYYEVPEPATMLVLALGAGLALLRRSR